MSSSAIGELSARNSSPSISCNVLPAIPWRSPYIPTVRLFRVASRAGMSRLRASRPSCQSRSRPHSSRMTLRTESPAPTRRTSASATCATSSALADARRAPRPPDTREHRRGQRLGPQRSAAPDARPRSAGSRPTRTALKTVTQSRMRRPTGRGRSRA